jgi:hypothetical protein
MVFNYEFASLVLVDALVMGDRRAAELHGISTRTLKRYRQRLKIDPHLAQLVFHLRQSVLAPKKPQISDAIDAAVEFIQDAPKHLDRENVEHLQMMTHAFKTLSEIQLANRMIDARLAALCGAAGTQPQQMDAASITYDIADRSGR